MTWETYDMFGGKQMRDLRDQQGIQRALSTDGQKGILVL